ncbi:hypothetical protein TNCV_3501341 [Trichonephila clavipes]|uniref:Uncharacterized protein n=1 Tax=Trichonephila clavipes TaxID=2585209 RepID=A0A8X6RY10_TRICX|nr:hypothetical protein TNCV_3501341 [Trichonephila clavipes]
MQTVSIGFVPKNIVSPAISGIACHCFAILDVGGAKQRITTTKDRFNSDTLTGVWVEMDIDSMCVIQKAYGLSPTKFENNPIQYFYTKKQVGRIDVSAAPRSGDMVVARCWQQWITEGRVYRRGGSGRPRNTNDREDRAIRRVATSAPTTSLASIQRHLPPSRHPVPSRETIRRRLTEVGEEPTSAKTLTTDPTS